ncbi:MAG: TonB family protein, partial [Marinicellaceae bacterium]
LVKGQGVEIDLIKAYAWAKASESNPEYSALTNNIEKSLSKEQLEKAQVMYKNQFYQYTLKNSKVLLGPISGNDDEDNQSNLNHDNISSKNIAPKYPEKLLRSGIQGWVDLNFNIYPDGSVRDIYVTDEVPANSFATAAIRSVSKYRYSFEKNGKKNTIDEPRNSTLRIEFKIGNPNSGPIVNDLNRTQKRQIEELIKSAEKGNVDSQYSYAYLYNTLLKRKGKVNGEKVNQWLFNAAINGNSGAQYRLGKNIYFGNDCKVEKQKGIDWIMQAAQMGSADAQYQAYKMLQNKDLVNQTNLPAFYWLQQAAENGLNIAQLYYAKEVSLLEEPTSNQLNTAKKYLKKYSKSLYETTQWYQVNAMFLNKTNKNKKALASVKKALKSAKKLGWDLTELQQLKNNIINNKA